MVGKDVIGEKQTDGVAVDVFWRGFGNWWLTDEEGQHCADVMRRKMVDGGRGSPSCLCYPSDQMRKIRSAPSCHRAEQGIGIDRFLLNIR